MSSMEELKSAIKENLEAQGILQETRAKLRADIFRVMDQPKRDRPELSNDNLIINELIREYFEFNGYANAASVLTAESGQPQVRMDRQFLVQELHVRQEAGCQQAPLLYSLLSYFMQRGQVGRRQQQQQQQFVSLPLSADAAEQQQQQQ